MRLLGLPVVVLGLLTVVGLSAAKGRDPAHPVRGDGERPYTVVFEFKRPYVENADALIAATGFRLYGRIRSGSLSAELTRGKLHEVLGLTFTVSLVKGAGNAIGADAYIAEIRNPGALKPEFKPLVRRVWINTDPKREVGDWDPEYTPGRKGGKKG